MQLISMKDAPQQPLFDTTGHDVAFDCRAQLLGAVAGVRALAKANHSSEHSGRHGDD